MAKVKSEQLDKVISQITIRFTNQKNRDLFGQFEVLIVEKQKELAKQKKMKIVKNDFYQDALILGIKNMLLENMTDDLVEISSKAMNKSLTPKINNVTKRNDLQFIHLSSEIEYMKSLLNYLFETISIFNPQQYDLATNGKEKIDKNFLKTPVFLEEFEEEILSKWRNKIRNDSSNEKIQKILELDSE